MNGLRRSLSSAQTDHQVVLQEVAVAEAQLRQALQDSQEQVSSYYLIPVTIWFVFSNAFLEKAPKEEAVHISAIILYIIKYSSLPLDIHFKSNMPFLLRV